MSHTQPAAGRLVPALAAGGAALLVVAVGLTAVGGGLVDDVAADSSAGGWGVLLGAVAEALLAAAVLGVRRSTAVWPETVGSVGAVLTGVGLAGMVAGGVATFATGDHEALGLPYVAGALLTFAGCVVLAVVSWRAGVLPRGVVVLIAAGTFPLLPPIAALAVAAGFGWLAVVLVRLGRPAPARRGELVES